MNELTLLQQVKYQNFFTVFTFEDRHLSNIVEFKVKPT